MAEYIEREKAIECIKPHVKPTTVYGEGYMRAIEHAVDILELIPAADVQPVKRGKWDFQGNQLFKCTNCNDIFSQEQLESIRKSFPNFCPNCGADLRGED